MLSIATLYIKRNMRKHQFFNSNRTKFISIPLHKIIEQMKGYIIWPRWPSNKATIGIEKYLLWKHFEKYRRDNKCIHSQYLMIINNPSTFTYIPSIDITCIITKSLIICKHDKSVTYIPAQYTTYHNIDQQISY